MFDLATHLLTTLASAGNALVGQLRAAGEELAMEPLFGALGLVVWPRAEVPTNAGTGLRPAGAAETVVGRIANRILPLAWRDLRLNARVPTLAEGDVCLVHYDGGTVHMRAAAGGGTQIVVYAPTLNGSGVVTKAHAITLDPTGATIQIQHADGPAVFLYADRVVAKNAGGNVYLEVGSTEIVLNGPVKITGGLTVGNPALAIPVELAGGVPATLIKGL